MTVTFDPTKNAINKKRHQLGLDEFTRFDDAPVVIADDRHDYGETRFRAFGRIAGRGYMIAYVVRDGRVRLISFRRAHEKELKRHGR